MAQLNIRVVIEETTLLEIGPAREVGDEFRIVHSARQTAANANFVEFLEEKNLWESRSLV